MLQTLSTAALRAILISALLLLPAHAAAQGGTDRLPATTASEFAARMTVARYLWTLLAHELTAASQDTVSRSWTMTFPDDKAPWSGLTSSLRLALRARDPDPGAVPYRSLVVGPHRIVNDTLRVEITVAALQCSPTTTMVGSSTYHVFAPWRSARFEEPRWELVVHSDYGCRRP